MCQGSSPRWRGAHAHAVAVAVVVRLIPALAGSTVRTALRDERRGAHPRAGGEHKVNADAKIVGTGSSPRWRGARRRLRPRLHRLGLIPALAGSTSSPCVMKPPAGAHPRAGGEHASAAVTMGRTLGSSPRWRGAHLLTCGFSRAQRQSTSLSVADLADSDSPCSSLSEGHPPHLRVALWAA